MTCQSVQNRILALSDPRQVPGPLHAHLTGCPACLAWWNRVARLERMIAHLPVPPAPDNKKAVLIDDLTVGPVITTVPALDRRSAWSPLAPRRATPAMKYVAGLAAAVLVAVGGWAVVRPSRTPDVAKAVAPKHPLLDKVVGRDLDLARATTPAQRLEILGGLADDLSAETRGLARVADPDELNDLARWFDRVVRAGIVRQAEQLPPHALTPEKRAALIDQLSAKLADAGREADAAAREAPPHAHPALKTIADSARDGRVKLRAIQTRGGA